MDNFHFDMVCTGAEMLEQAITLVFKATGNVGTYHDGRKRGATHYAILEPTEADAFRPAKPLRLVFCRPYSALTDPNKHALPFVLDAKAAADFAQRWLEVAEYPKEPDIDGDSKKGWRVYNDEWGQVDGDHTSIIAVAPEWAMYGK